MMKWKGFLLLLIGFALLYAVQYGNIATGSYVDAGKTEYIHTKVVNGENKQRFFSEVHNGSSVRWNYDVYTTEGDPIHCTLEYDANRHEYQITIDTRDDKFGHPSVTVINCKGYSYEEDQLTSCDQPPGIVPLEGETVHPK
ncbi:DUF4362 domain-containing protein [Brevibacillus sp. H7]|uniref:DUF4362 domain-containing protein n=1 Tax=Brevibacillus sp. H7 TaxID=3349138 RepID=UPI00382EE1B0